MSNPGVGNEPFDAGDSQLERYVAAFEEAAAETGAELDDSFLPPHDHPERCEIATELVRVDLELSREKGQARSLDEYRELVPDVFASPKHLAEAAYEELRLRRGSGESVNAQEYLDRYQLPLDSWPAPLHERGVNEERAFPKPGVTFGGARLQEVIGSGAHGRVYLARQPEFGNRLVAVKITAERSIEPQFLGRLQHTNIVPIYSAHNENGWLGICMPFLGVMTLADALPPSSRPRQTPSGLPESTLNGRIGSTVVGDQRQNARRQQRNEVEGGTRRPFTWREAADCAAQLADGLQHAHERGVVHSDVKPANVLMGDDGVPRLLDFNLAGEAAAQDGKSLIVGGTLPYMAPEHLEALLHGKPVAPASDVYSLGVILYEMLACRRPFPDRQGPLEQNATQLLADRRKPAPGLERDNATPGLQAIVRKCLASDPADRYASAASLAEDLRCELADRALLHTHEPSIVARLGTWRRRNRRSIARAGVFLVGLTAAAVLTLWQLSERRIADAAALARFDRAVRTVRSALVIPHAEPDLLSLGRESAALALAEFDVLENEDWHTGGRVARLNESNKARVLHSVHELGLLLQTAPFRIEGADLPFSLPEHARSSDPPSVAAKRLFEQHRFAKAVRLLSTATSESARDPVLWMQLGVAQLAVGDNESALQNLTAAIALDPLLVMAWRHRAAAFLDSGQPNEALEDFERASRYLADSPTLKLDQAIALLELGRLKEAEEKAIEAIELGTRRPRAWLLRARIREKLGDTEGAEKDRQAVLARKDDHSENWRADDWAALVVSRKGSDPEEALALVEEGLTYFPWSISLLRNQIHLLGDVLRRPQDALAPAEKILELQPDDLRARLSRAVIFARTDQKDKALAAGDQIAGLALRPVDRLQLACVYALCYDKQRKDDAMLPKSRRQLQLALAAEPGLALRAVNDPDLASLRSDPMFRRAIAAAAALVNPLATQTP